MNPILYSFIIALLTFVSVTGHSIRGAHPSSANINLERRLTSLHGTKWTASYYNSTTSLPISPNYPITLLFSSTKLSGGTGCNRYFGGYEELSDNSFSTGRCALTRKYCRQVDEQEKSYIQFLTGRIFFYEINSTDDENEYELTLFDYTVGTDGQPMQTEDVLAKFSTANDFVLNEDVSEDI